MRNTICQVIKLLVSVNASQIPDDNGTDEEEEGTEGKADLIRSSRRYHRYFTAGCWRIWAGVMGCLPTNDELGKLDIASG